MTMNENVVEGNGEKCSSFGSLSPPFNEGEKFMGKANAIIGDLNDERNKVRNGILKSDYIRYACRMGENRNKMHNSLSPLSSITSSKMYCRIIGFIYDNEHFHSFLP